MGTTTKKYYSHFIQNDLCKKFVFNKKINYWELIKK